MKQDFCPNKKWDPKNGYRCHQNRLNCATIPISLFARGREKKSERERETNNDRRSKVIPVKDGIKCTFYSATHLKTERVLQREREREKK